MSKHRLQDTVHDGLEDNDVGAFLAYHLPSVRMYSEDAAASLEAAVVALDTATSGYAGETVEQRSLTSLKASLIYALSELDEGSQPDIHVKAAIKLLLGISQN